MTHNVIEVHLGDAESRKYVGDISIIRELVKRNLPRARFVHIFTDEDSGKMTVKDPSGESFDLKKIDGQLVEIERVAVIK